MSQTQPPDDANALGHLYAMAHAHAVEHGLDAHRVTRLCDVACAELATLAYARDRAVRSREHTEQWYAARLERLKAFGEEKGFWPEMAAIIANGTVASDDPLNFERQINVERYRAQEAERRLGVALDRLKEAEEEVAVMKARLALVAPWAARVARGG